MPANFQMQWLSVCAKWPSLFCWIHSNNDGADVCVTAGTRVSSSKSKTMVISKKPVLNILEMSPTASRQGYISYSQLRLRQRLWVLVGCRIGSGVDFISVVINRGLNTKAILFTNPCFDLQLCGMGIKVAQMRLLCRTLNLAHHSGVRSSAIWKEFGIEPPHLNIETYLD